MESFITKDGKKLRRGYTTGSCAAAAAKAASLMLLGGKRLESVYLLTPRGIGLTLSLRDIRIEDGMVCCGVQKDGGDDPDVTNGIVIYAKVEKTAAGIRIDGGEGIGRVTKPGLDQPVGNAAINSTPRRMIEEELRTVMEEHGYTCGLHVTVFAPEGIALAEKTFNPRLGVVGGISILGTTGVVEPMSDDAIIDTIRTELHMRCAEGKRYILLTPGNYGADYIKNTLKLPPETAVTTSNFIGDALQSACDEGFHGALIAGHIGKLIKLAGGLFNTHSRWGDCRAEIFAAHAGCCGADSSVLRRIMSSVMTDDMLDILQTAGLQEAVMESVMRSIHTQLAARPFGAMKTGVIAFSNKFGFLGATADAAFCLEKIKGE